MTYMDTHIQRQGGTEETFTGLGPAPNSAFTKAPIVSEPWVSNSHFAELHLASLLCRYFNYADMFLDSFKYVYYLLIRP